MDMEEVEKKLVVMRLEGKNCGICENKGYLIQESIGGGYLEIQNCDECEIFGSDEEATEYYIKKKEGIK